MIAEKSRKRRPRGEWFWEAMVAACGNHCCAPGCMKVGLLEQGHIEPFGDGAHDNSENLIPLCRTCNFKYAKLKTPDGRPEGWRESFFILLANELRARFIVRHDISSCATIAPCESAENKDVLVWPKPDFRSGKGYLPHPMLQEKRRMTWWKKSNVPRSRRSPRRSYQTRTGASN